RDFHVTGVQTCALPIFGGALRAGGALEIDYSGDFAWHHHGDWKVRFDSGVKLFTMSRPYLEAEVRRRTLALPRVRCLDAHDLVEDRKRVVWATSTTNG